MTDDRLQMAPLVTLPASTTRPCGTATAPGCCTALG